VISPDPGELVARLVDAGMAMDPDAMVGAVRAHLAATAPNVLAAIEASIVSVARRRAWHADVTRARASVRRAQASARRLATTIAARRASPP